MADSWATRRGDPGQRTDSSGQRTDGRGGLGTDLHLDLPPGGGSGVRVALIRALRDAARSGRLAPGTRLPSSRSLATDLGIARNTVADAYGELVAEGWLTARQGSGTRVAERVVPPEPAPPRTPPAAAAAATRPTYDLRPGEPDVSAFPRTAWLSAARRALIAAPNDAFGYGHPPDGPSCGGSWPTIWRAPAGCGPRPNGSWSARGSSRGWPCSARCGRRPDTVRWRWSPTGSTPTGT
ncbi:hypothetical protein SANT12839_043240 [Streptomyces antimycoticus]|uniref:HTH gntR-type domain-containing protein n=1 Tax=Streptomyces antimycoticus TaxID=68175 RepID=A0A4D4K5Q1_9ACTN|nr:hypothetical protein SANT12839_043240 [Streptomyces antimycoticus]